MKPTYAALERKVKSLKRDRAFLLTCSTPEARRIVKAALRWCAKTVKKPWYRAPFDLSLQRACAAAKATKAKG